MGEDTERRRRGEGETKGRGREAERQRGREAERQRGREAERQRGREAERQRGREAERQRGREAERRLIFLKILAEFFKKIPPIPELLCFRFSRLAFFSGSQKLDPSTCGPLSLDRLLFM